MMAESMSKASEKLGLPPGSLIHVGEKLEENSIVTVVDYSKELVQEKVVRSVQEILPYIEKNSVTWINVEGLNNIAFIESIGEHLGIHPLVLEDILNTKQRPKLEVYENHIFFVTKAMSCPDNELAINYEQISMLLFNNCLCTFRERRDDLFAPIRRRLDSGKGKFRSQGSDYLAYVILDTVVDQYFVIIDFLETLFESIEEKLLDSPSSKTLASIQKTKRELIHIRKIVSPHRELLSQINRSESDLIQERTLIYFSDVYDHAVRVVEAMDSYRDLATGMLDIYLSSVSNKMNETMKVLTVFASIFIPLTFVAGIYGMNFEHMPELKWKWSYPILWGFFIAIPIVLTVYFKRKRWL